MYAPNSKNWVAPRTQIEREFLLDTILMQLNGAKGKKIGSLIDLDDKSIRWLIKEAQEIFKRENSLVEI